MKKYQVTVTDISTGTVVHQAETNCAIVCLKDAENDAVDGLLYGSCDPLTMIDVMDALPVIKRSMAEHLLFCLDDNKAPAPSVRVTREGAEMLRKV